jgi:hypothetical protein
MTDGPAPRGDVTDFLPTLGGLPFDAERWAILVPKLAAVLTQFGQIDELERADLEPALPMPERWDGDERG